MFKFSKNVFLENKMLKKKKNEFIENFKKFKFFNLEISI
jgi:hypothetical protein